MCNIKGRWREKRVVIARYGEMERIKGENEKAHYSNLGDKEQVKQR